MAHQYYLKGFGLQMHMSLAKGGYHYGYAGTIICPTNAELHKKTISRSSGRETKMSPHYDVWKIEGIEREFNSGKQIVAVYDLEAVKADEVDWVI